MNFNLIPKLMKKKRACCFQDQPCTELVWPKGLLLIIEQCPAQLPAYYWHLVGMVLNLFGIWPSLTGNNTGWELAFLTA